MKISMICGVLLLVLLAPVGASVRLDESDLLKDVSLQVGQELHLALAANATTGYSWLCTLEPEDALEVTRDEYVADAAAAGVVGKGGTQHFTLVAVKPGEVRVDIRYRQDRVDGDSEMSRSLHVQVVGEGCDVPEPVQVTEADFVPNEILQVDEVATVVLRENLSTGFSWRSWWSPERGLRLVLERSQGPAETGLVGAGGSHRWVFRGAHEGRVILYFQYRRPWAGGEQEAARRMVLLVPAG